MANTVTVSGMFGSGKTYFAGSPVVIDISGLAWPAASPFNVVIVEVVYDGTVVGEFRQDTGGQTKASFDVSSALRALWADYTFEDERGQADAALGGTAWKASSRAMRSYYLHIYTEYLAGDDGGVFTRTQCTDAQGRKDIPGGQCLLGGLTEWERAGVGSKENADASYWEHTNPRFGDASTKPLSSPERVGRDSITSWADVQAGYTRTVFYPASATPQQDDQAGSASGWTGHAPLVLRDTFPYTDFLFVNRRGAVETCSAPAKEALAIDTETKQYARAEGPSFIPQRTVMAVTSGGRRSWQMSSGQQTREWLEWWSLDFLKAERLWTLYGGRYVPVTVKPAKGSTPIYDRAKQHAESVDFTVTLALEG